MNNIFEGLGNKKVLILGFGEEGKSSYRIIRKEYPDKDIYVADKKTKEELLLDSPVVTRDDIKLHFICGDKYLENLADFDYIIKTPGIPPIDAPSVTQTEIFFEKCLGKVIGVTGTKGKSTTATLIYEILKHAGLRVYLIGNIGTPALDILEKDNSADAIYVYELSSHQLYNLKKSPNIAVILNLGSDHLDWHGTQEKYLEAKLNIIAHQEESDCAVINESDEELISSSVKINSKISLFSGKSLETKFSDILSLRGEHNKDNVSAAVSVSRLLGVDDEIVGKVLKDFKGLEHRLEYVGEHGGVKFFNDSISTNPVSLKAAIDSFEEELTLIMGGYERGIDYQEMCKDISRQKNIKSILLIGQTGKRLIAELSKSGFKGRIEDCGEMDMDSIVKKALELTEAGGIVLLSPAAASFDMYKDFKDRGNKFKTAVGSLT